MKFTLWLIVSCLYFYWLNLSLMQAVWYKGTMRSASIMQSLQKRLKDEILEKLLQCIKILIKTHAKHACWITDSMWYTKILLIFIIIINSYSSRTRRIWADIYKQQGRRPSWLSSAHIRQELVIISSCPASPRRITVLVNSSNSLDFFRWNLLKSWHFLYWRRRENIFSDLQNFSTRNSPSVFPYLVILNDNGSYYGLREPIRKLENHYPELKIY